MERMQRRAMGGLTALVSAGALALSGCTPGDSSPEPSPTSAASSSQGTSTPESTSTPEAAAATTSTQTARARPPAPRELSNESQAAVREVLADARPDAQISISVQSPRDIANWVAQTWDTENDPEFFGYSADELDNSDHACLDASRAASQGLRDAGGAVFSAASADPLPDGHISAEPLHHRNQLSVEVRILPSAAAAEDLWPLMRDEDATCALATTLADLYGPDYETLEGTDQPVLIRQYSSGSDVDAQVAMRRELTGHRIVTTVLVGQDADTGEPALRQVTEDVLEALDRPG
ncbi:MAG: hypothetical protein Q4G34_09275 [Micrococcus sp.]|nr:hypothetical protein [Micrococcus sp.]